MKELVEVMAKSLVSNPSAVVVEEETTGTSTVLRLHVAPEDMDYKYGLGRGSEVSAINGNPNADWDYSCEFKTLTTRTFYQLDGTYTVYEGWYSMSGDFTATPKQIASSLGIDPYKAFGSCAIVGKFYDERRGDYTEVAFRYLRP